MATATRRTLVANPAKRRRRKRNGPKKMSAKQIKFFGTARQRAALKSSRKRKRKVTANRPKHRKRTVAKSNPRRTARRARKSSHRKNSHRRRTVRRNFGEIVSLVNPAKRRKKSMAKARRRKKSTATRRHHRRVANRGHRRHTRRARNPFGGTIGADVVEVLYMIGGGVGSKLLTQVVLTTSNTGIIGYLGNIAAGGILAWGVKAFMHNAKAARDIFKGAILQVVLRAITDYTPFGSYTSQLGMGDYMASNWVSPQRYVDALNSAEVQIPSGWGGAPAMVVASSGVNASALGAGNGDGSGMY